MRFFLRYVRNKSCPPGREPRSVIRDFSGSRRLSGEQTDDGRPGQRYIAIQPVVAQHRRSAQFTQRNGRSLVGSRASSQLEHSLGTIDIAALNKVVFARRSIAPAARSENDDVQDLTQSSAALAAASIGTSDTAPPTVRLCRRCRQ
jgi:hypothetical protein